jgi:hypothetical protein
MDMQERANRIIGKIVMENKEKGNPEMTHNEVYKQFLIELFTEDIKNGEPIEKMIVSEFDPQNVDQLQKMRELIEEGFMMETEDETVYIVNPEFFHKIRRERK